MGAVGLEPTNPKVPHFEVKALSERPKRRVVVNGEFLNELPKNKKSTFNNSHQ